MKKNIYNALVIFSLSIVLSGCENFFNVKADDLLLEENYPSTVTELYSGYLGITAKVQSVADQASFLEGLRGDFLEPTPYSTQDIIDIYNHVENNDNKLADPVGYYAVILNANDYIQHATQFYEANPKAIDDATFKALIGGAIRYKAWAYFMLAKIYGEAIWIDDPLIEYKDLSSYNRLSFDEIITKCIDLIETGVKINGNNIDGKGIVYWSIVLFPGNSRDYTWDCVTPDPDLLLGELYMYSGNYALSYSHLMNLLRYGSAENMYEITKSEYNGEWIDIFRSYVRKEGIFVLTYDYNLNQTNRLIDYYSNDAPNKYYLRPSQAAMDRFNNQIQSNGNLGDLWRGNNRTFIFRNNEWVVYKFISAHLTADKVYRNDVAINLYRASDLHLWLAEVLGQMGRFTEAIAFLDGGLETYYNTKAGVFISPFESYPTTLYYSSADGTTQGIRGRVALNKVGNPILKTPSANIDEDKKKLDLLLLEETCLESAGEARAYYAMIRMAKRWNDPSILADRVSAKYPAGIKESMKTKLMDQKNWFIKHDVTLNEK